MSLLAPGSTLWMIRHEVRLAWRAYPRSGKVGMIVALVILGGFVGVGGGLLGWTTRFLTPERLQQAMPWIVLLADGALAFVFSIMLAQSMGAATTVFYDRGDLDLLLSSPVKPQRVLLVRMLGMAFNVTYLFIGLVFTFLLAAATLGRHPGWLAGFVVLIALGLAATASGVLVAMALFKVLGPRRTRTVAQVLGAVIGATLFMASQMHALLGESRSRDAYRTARQFSDLVETNPWMAWPAQAAMGHPGPLLSLLGVALVLFFGASWLLGRRFADNAAAAVGEVQPARTSRASAAARPFRSGLRRVMVAKEMRLIFRDPALISQVLLQILYLVPASFLIIRGVGRAGGEGLMTTAALASGASILTFMAGQLAAGFGWLTMSAEEAPELLACAPVTPQAVARAKVTAVLIPTLVLVAIPVLIVARYSPWAGLCAGLGAAGCATMIAYVELWTQKPAKRADFRMRRKGTGSGLTYLLEFFLSGLAGVAVGLISVGGLLAALAILPLGLIGLVLAILKKDKWLNG